MFFFLFKKSFFDAWDNLGALIVSNLVVFVTGIAGIWPILRILENGSFAGFPILIILIPLITVVAGTVSVQMNVVADYRKASWSDIPAALKASWKPALYLAVLASAFFGLSAFGMNYYSRLGNMVGLAAMALLFWISLGAYLTVMWFFPVLSRLSGGFGKSLKKCGLVMLDNLGLSLFAGIIMTPLMMVLWPLTAFGGFGPAGILLYYHDALRLLMFKYDWLEAHPDSKKRDIPWFELLIDERERVGKRTIKGMIFPWKD